jgi:hypothetical protein
MPRPHAAVSVLVSHWDHGWDLFILDPDDGLIGQTHIVDRHDVEYATRVYLREHHPEHAREEIMIIDGANGGAAATGIGGGWVRAR